MATTNAIASVREWVSETSNEAKPSDARPLRRAAVEDQHRFAAPIGENFHLPPADAPDTRAERFRRRFLGGEPGGQLGHARR